jgi:hypothetical protein
MALPLNKTVAADAVHVTALNAKPVLLRMFTRKSTACPAKRTC